MMGYGYHLVVCLILMLVQTVIIPLLPQLRGFDLYIIYVIYLGYSSGFFQGLLITVMTGAVLDTISVAYFGTYMTVYFWLFLFVRVGLAYFHTASPLFVAGAAAAGIAIENLVFWHISWVSHSLQLFPVPGIRCWVLQTVLGVSASPVLIKGFDELRKAWQEWFEPHHPPRHS